jgi:general secretion pathway protein G
MKKTMILLIVAGFAALIFAVTYVNVDRDPRRPMFGATRAAMANIHAALEMHKLDCGNYPVESAGLQSLVTDVGTPGWKGPYLKHLPTDSWGKDFRYAVTDGKPVTRSGGPAMQFDTADDITDR